MAWIDHPTQVYTMVKLDRPLIDIPPVPHTHRDPLRTPEDAPFRAPWISAHIDGVYHLTSYDVEHHRFPDVEDAHWAMGIVSPPSPSRRNSLKLLPDVNSSMSSHYEGGTEGLEWEMGMASPQSPSRRNSLELPPDDDPDAISDVEHPVILSSPPPSMRSLAGLSDSESDWPPPSDFDCPQLSPPSPIHRNTVLPLLEFEAHSLFIEEPSPPYVDPPDLSTVDPPLRAEHRALLSLRDRTLYAERTSRARNKALRGRERELGCAVATLRDTAESGPDPAPDAVTTLHAYRTAATRVMLERTEEKRRRKKDKERLKELRVLLGAGVDALLSTEGEMSPETSTDLRFGLDAAPERACGLGLALHAPPSAKDRARALAERTHIMRRLTACMTMRRRDLGMRSLVEAENMADGADEVPVRPPCRRSGLAHAASFVVPRDPGQESSVLELEACAQKHCRGRDGL